MGTKNTLIFERVARGILPNMGSQANPARVKAFFEEALTGSVHSLILLLTIVELETPVDATVLYNAWVAQRGNLGYYYDQALNYSAIPFDRHYPEYKHAQTVPYPISYTLNWHKEFRAHRKYIWQLCKESWIMTENDDNPWHAFDNSTSVSVQNGVKELLAAIKEIQAK